MVAAPFLLFPFSKLVWLAFDLTLRPDREGTKGRGGEGMKGAN
jgi:hypothetical protein